MTIRIERVDSGDSKGRGSKGASTAGAGRADAMAERLVRGGRPVPSTGKLQRSDADRVAGTLRHTVEAEQQLRTIVDSATSDTLAETARAFGNVPRTAVSATSDPLEQAALIRQLDRSLPFHEDRLQLRATQERMQELLQLRDSRVQGMLTDAAAAGEMAGIPDQQQPALAHLAHLQDALVQTYQAAGKTVGEAAGATEASLKNVRSGMLTSFLTRLAAAQPESARELRAQWQGVLSEKDDVRVGKVVKEGLQDRAVAALESAHGGPDGVDYTSALAALDQDAEGLAESEQAVVRRQLTAARARQEYIRGKEAASARRKAYDDFYALVDTGDVRGAQRLLDEAVGLTASQRDSMRSSLQEERWETDPQVLLEWSDRLAEVGPEGGLDIIPGKNLSQADATLLRQVAQAQGTRAAVENRLLLRSVARVLAAMPEGNAAHRAEAVRTLMGAVVDARTQGDDPVPLLTAGMAGNVVEPVLAAYGSAAGVLTREGAPKNHPQG